MRKRIVVAGSTNMDLVCTAASIPVPGETVLGSDFHTFAGGKGANQAVAVARLGYPVSLIGKVGDDDFGQRLRRELDRARVDTRAISSARATPSGVALISTDVRGQNSIVVVPGANGRLLPQDLDKVLPLLRSAGMILAQLEVPLATVVHLAEIARRSQVPLMLDPAPARKLGSRLLRRVDVLTPNETEVRTLCGLGNALLDGQSAKQCAHTLRSLGSRNVIVTMGKRGGYFLSEHGPGRSFPAYTVNAVDTTAAGDAFNGALAVALMEGKGVDAAIPFAAAAAALSVTRMGAQSSMPTKREVLRFCRSQDACRVR